MDKQAGELTCIIKEEDDSNSNVFLVMDGLEHSSDLNVKLEENLEKESLKEDLSMDRNQKIKSEDALAIDVDESILQDVDHFLAEEFNCPICEFTTKIKSVLINHVIVHKNLGSGRQLRHRSTRRNEFIEAISLDNADSDIDQDRDDDSVVDPNFVPGGDIDVDLDEEEFPTFDFGLLDDADEGQDNEDDSHVEPDANDRATRILWRRNSSTESQEIPHYLGPDHEFSNDLRQPIEYVRNFLTDDFLDLFVRNSNLYSVQRNPNKPLNVDQNEFEQFLGVCLYFSISKLPNTRMHWSMQLGSLRDIVAEIMSRGRWEEIKSKLHMVDNTTLDPNCNDKLFKVRPMVDHLRDKFQKIPMMQNLCIGEQLVPFKGRSEIKQYIPSKPHKWGYKMFVLADRQGMTYDFIPYTGKIEPVNDPAVPDLKASSNAVLHLAQSIPSNNNHLLYFDNRFTSLPLLRHLATRKIWCCGTVRVARIPGIKKGKDADKDIMKKGRGSYEEQISTGEDIEITFVKWYNDNKIVNLVSTFATSNPLSTVCRYDSKQHCKVEVPCPNVVKLYNSSIGGVDLADRLIALYRINIRSKKYYHRLIFHMIDMVIVNSWLLYKRDAANLKLPKSEILLLAPFKLKVAMSLMKDGKNIRGIKRERPSCDNKITKKPSTARLCQALPEKPMRFDNVGHWPSVEKNRRRCKRPGCKGGKTNILCSKCKINLCLNSTNNCFTDFHNK